MSKQSTEMKRFRAVVTVEFEAQDRAAAVLKAKEIVDVPNAKVRVQEAALSWLTIPDAAPTS
jgi:hypothetical protein